MLLPIGMDFNDFEKVVGIVYQAHYYSGSNNWCLVISVRKSLVNRTKWRLTRPRDSTKFLVVVPFRTDWISNSSIRERGIWGLRAAIEMSILF